MTAARWKKSSLSKQDAANCTSLLQEAEMFKKLSPEHLKILVGQMKLRQLQNDDELLRQGELSDRFFLVDKGQIRRTRVDETTGKTQIVEFAIQAKSINSMRVISGEEVFSTVKCVSENCKVYEMMRSDLLATLQEYPTLTTQIAEGLCEQLRIGSKKFATPLLEQQQADVINFPAVSIAAGIESYYRSMLNAILNTRLTGIPAEWFPNMHIQVPVRIAYIAGFKGLRSYFDHNVHPEMFEHPTAVRIATAVSPGIIMTPISSVLEATNAGHMNPEPLTVRWMRGLVPRAAREIIFGVGLNQLSDYFEERLQPQFSNAMMANAAGSLAAGVVSGYLSHVPHNISTLRLLEPHRSYRDLYQSFVDKSVPTGLDKQLSSLSAPYRNVARTVIATLFPRGVMIRTTQIVGSFMILNGTINYLQLREQSKIHRAVAGGP